MFKSKLKIRLTFTFNCNLHYVVRSKGLFNCYVMLFSENLRSEYACSDPLQGSEGAMIPSPYGAWRVQ